MSLWSHFRQLINTVPCSMCFCLRTPDLIYIVDSLTLNSWMKPHNPCLDSSSTCIFSVRHTDDTLLTLSNIKTALQHSAMGHFKHWSHQKECHIENCEKCNSVMERMFVYSTRAETRSRASSYSASAGDVTLGDPKLSPPCKYL